MPQMVNQVLTVDKGLKNFLILCHTMVGISIRDIIGTVMTEADWTLEKYSALSKKGRECFNLVLSVFTEYNIQLYAVCIELPLQIKIYIERCSSHGIRADTT
eukprot:CAMPEP_0167748750 /NCGR_PEP_ID=MMETSP0110_2-20121227/5011_1 /TAXON_ID=629695 /ORGANISM="Gymnochlora sp., Strain CCMP2014" /LENGTH=101 /DNA_ID=CAMNT_0007633799 /DNA_START=150 /DNA_END=451 /DNA_ORIENTATION=-